MDKIAEDRAVDLLAEAAASGVRLNGLQLESHPQSPAEAQAIQERVVAKSGKTVAGWKVATTAQGVATYGAIYEDDCFESGAVVSKARYPLMGIEGEVAFRFTVHLPKGGAISREDLEKVLTPFPVIEIVASRFADYESTPSLVRLADRMSNGGIVLGRAAGKPGRLDRLNVKLARDDETMLDQVGGHPRSDPLLPVLEFVNLVRATRSFLAGEFITAGTFTGMLEGQAGERWDVAFAGLGEVSVKII